MLLIQSRETDVTTSAVIRWLIHNEVKVRRVNGAYSFLDCKFHLSSQGNVEIGITDRDNSTIAFNKISAFWYRRGDWHIGIPKIEHFPNQTIAVLSREWAILRETIEYFLETIPYLGSIKKEKYHNKITTLIVASSAGLTIPETLITGNKSHFQDFVDSNNCITKAIWNMFNIVENGRNRTVGTHRISKTNIKELQAVSFPSLIQIEVEKEYELRIFFIKDAFYSMAIFSQLDAQTEIDFRNYNREKPNRAVPFKLPITIKRKLLKFIEAMNIDSGSIDMIVTSKGEFIFLEVNHIGQFGWVSHNCNYFLEEKIASYFKNRM